MRPFGPGPGSLAPELVNRALEREAWAQSSLALHAGRTVKIAVGPAKSRFRIDASGKVDTDPSAASAPDLTLTLSPLAVPSFLADPRRWDELVAADGDAALAATLKGLAETLPWFVERAFERALGPIVGQRFADAGRQLLAFPEYAARRVGESVASYARDEVQLAASRMDARAFGNGVETIALRVGAAAARIDTLGARLKPANE